MQYRDSIFYDAAVTFMLAILMAANDLDDPTAVTGAQVRDEMYNTSVVSGGEVVRCGPDEFARAIDFISAGTAINYTGPSGPMDYDNGNVRSNLRALPGAGRRLQGRQKVRLRQRRQLRPDVEQLSRSSSCSGHNAA